MTEYEGIAERRRCGRTPPATRRQAHFRQTFGTPASACGLRLVRLAGRPFEQLTMWFPYVVYVPPRYVATESLVLGLPASSNIATLRSESSMFKYLLGFILLAGIFDSEVLASLVQGDGRAVSSETFESLEELARIVDIAYCVGSTGIHKPFQCLSRCKDFPSFELITTWNTGPLLSDSCGYIALSHEPQKKRVIVAFRGTYSIANTIADLSTIPAKYVPFPDGKDDHLCAQTIATNTRVDLSSKPSSSGSPDEDAGRCDNCTAHLGFLTSWRNTRCIIMPDIALALRNYPDYELTLVGHSLGGAVAALAGLEFQTHGWKPHITTFGEPRIGNKALNDFIDRRFNLNSTDVDHALYKRVTHVDDPVPLLPLEEWGFRMHSGEIFISKPTLPPMREDLKHCEGPEDPSCIEGMPSSGQPTDLAYGQKTLKAQGWGIPHRYRLWELFFAHRDYFWRIGLCLPGGAPPIAMDQPS